MDVFSHLEIEPARGTGMDPVLAYHFQNDAGSFHQAGLQLLEKGYLPQAADMLDRALGFREHDPHLWIDAIDTLARAGQLDKAEARSREALANYRRSAVIFPAHALVFAHRGRFSEAHAHCQVAFDHAQRASHWYAHTVRGEILLREGTGNRHDALDCFERAIDGAPERWRPAYMAANALQQAALPVLAAGAAAEVAHWRPRACLGWLTLAQCFESLRLFDHAEFYYGCVLEMEPNHPIAAHGRQHAKNSQFGLTRVFRRNDLQGRWRTAFEQALNQTG